MAATTTDAEHAFWTYQNRASKYEDLAVEYERNIETKHPETVTSRGMCTCLKWGAAYCVRAGTNVEYPEYCGPDVKNI